jgi:maltokinase
LCTSSGGWFVTVCVFTLSTVDRADVRGVGKTASTSGRLRIVEPTDDQLLAVIGSWLPSRRWFAGKGHEITDLRMVARHSISGAPEAAHLVVAVQVDGKHWQIYQVPVTMAASADPATLVGRIGGVSVHDGTAYESVLTGLLTQDTERAELVPNDDSPRTHWLAKPESLAGYRLLNVEQSNTSVVVGDSMVKLFRMLTPGVNPDIEVHEGLARAECHDVGQLRGWISGGWVDPGSDLMVHGHLAMVQEFFSDSVDGWDLARQRVADGEDFTIESQSLGQATARMHRALAQAFPTSEVAEDQIVLMAQRLHRRLTSAAQIVPELRDMEDALQLQVDGLLQLGRITVQRVHGDYHLGQTLRTPHGWRVLDFEGEPGGDFENRRVLDHPLRDVAGMLRSFDYAAWQGGGNSAQARQWQQACERAFLAGYVHDGAAPSLNQTLLQAYLVDKAAYEAVYEKRNRPEWIGIPLTALKALVGT